MRDRCRGETDQRMKGRWCSVCDLESREVKMGKKRRENRQRVMGHLGKGGEMERKVKGERSM